MGRGGDVPGSRLQGAGEVLTRSDRRTDRDSDCITVEDVLRGKPDPEGILTARTRANTERVWMVGDNRDDIAAALAAGAVAIGVGENRAALLEAGAAVVLDDINEIEALL